MQSSSLVATKEAAPLSVSPDGQDAASEPRKTPVPTATLDADGLTCGSLEPLIAQHLRALTPGDVLEIRSDREEAADGIRAWVWLTGHTLVSVEKDPSSRGARYFVRKKTPAI